MHRYACIHTRKGLFNRGERYGIQYFGDRCNHHFSDRCKSGELFFNRGGVPHYVEVIYNLPKRLVSDWMVARTVPWLPYAILCSSVDLKEN